MVKRLLVALAFLGFCGPQARAEMVLLVEPDWTTYLVNEGNEAIRLGAYHLHADTEIFDTETWNSIEDQRSLETAALVASLGPKAVGFVEAAPQPRSLSELALLAYGLWQPGQRVSIGKPFRVGLSGVPEMVFEYLDVTEGFDKWRVSEGSVRSGVSVPAPEPSAWVLAALGCCMAWVVRKPLGNQND